MITIHLLVTLSQLEHVATLSLHGEGGDGKPEAHVVHGSALLINRDLGRDGSKTIDQLVTLTLRIG